MWLPQFALSDYGIPEEQRCSRIWTQINDCGQRALQKSEKEFRHFLYWRWGTSGCILDGPMALKGSSPSIQWFDRKTGTQPLVQDTILDLSPRVLKLWSRQCGGGDDTPNELIRKQITSQEGKVIPLRVQDRRGILSWYWGVLKSCIASIYGLLVIIC